MWGRDSTGSGSGTIYTQGVGFQRPLPTFCDLLHLFAHTVWHTATKFWCDLCVLTRSQEKIIQARPRPQPLASAPCGLWGCKNWPAPFPGRMSYKATKPGLASVLYLSVFFIVLVFIRASFYVLLVFIVRVLSFGCSS